MRMILAAFAITLAACDGSVSGSDGAAPPAGGYTLEIRAAEAVQSYLVITPDGRTVGARSAEGVSALMDSARAQALAAEPPPQGEDVPEVMALRVPGFEMSIGATEEDAAGDQGQVRMSFGDGAERIVVNADEGGPGDADDRAYVRVTGADEESVREFISEADELSPDVQAQMLTELGLN